MSDLGGETNYSEAEKALVGRASCLIVELEHMEMRFALKDGASPDQLKVYQTTVNTLRRTLDRAAVEGPRMHRIEIAYIILGASTLVHGGSGILPASHNWRCGRLHHRALAQLADHRALTPISRARDNFALNDLNDQAPRLGLR
jgi:hypothetical protein